MELNAFSNMLATWLLAKKLHMQRHTARAPLRCQSCTWWIQEESPRLRKLKTSGKLGAQTVLIYLWHRHLRIGSLPKDLSAALMDIWTKLALAFSFQILEPLCVKRCAVGMAASESRFHWFFRFILFVVFPLFRFFNLHANQLEKSINATKKAFPNTRQELVKFPGVRTCWRW